MRTSLLSIAAALIAVAFFGCQTTGMDRSRKTTSDMQQARQDLAKGTTRLDETTAALDAMNASPEKNLTGNFSAYRGKLAGARSAALSISNRAERMKSDGDTYFDEWEKECAMISNEEIRTLSTDRRKEQQNQFKEITASFITVKEVYDAALSDLNDIERHLSNDLTTVSIKALTPTADKIKAKIQTLRAESTGLLARLDALIASMSPADVKSK